MVNFVGQRYSAEIAVSEVPDNPIDVGAAWLGSQSPSDANGDDLAWNFLAPGLINNASLAVSSEGAIEWYAQPSPEIGVSATSITLPGVSRMYLPSLPSGGIGYALVFHPAGLDAKTMGTKFAGGYRSGSVISGAVAQYQSSVAALTFAAKNAVDGSLDFYIRSTNSTQEVRLFERNSNSGALQNVLLATATAGQTLRLQFAPDANFVNFSNTKGAAPLDSVHLSGSMAGNAGPVLSPRAMGLDLQDFGLYRIYGTVELKGTPNTPLYRRVELWNQRDKRLIRETWSDATTGAYAFEGIKGGPDVRYCAVAYDHTGTYQGVIADNLTPEPMP